jgi:hypothetical protein
MVDSPGVSATVPKFCVGEVLIFCQTCRYFGRRLSYASILRMRTGLFALRHFPPVVVYRTNKRATTNTRWLLMYNYSAQWCTQFMAVPVHCRDLTAGHYRKCAFGSQLWLNVSAMVVGILCKSVPGTFLELRQSLPASRRNLTCGVSL